MNAFSIRRAAVLGAGVMGAQLAAHLANASVPVRLFDLASENGDSHALVRQAIARLRKLKPAPLAQAELSEAIVPCTYAEDLALLDDCDLIIEAVAERMDIKRDLYAKVAPHLHPHAFFVTNTSGLSIAELCEALPEQARGQFFGAHFFNPPRYMHLVELIPGPHTDSESMKKLEAFLTSSLGKGVIYAKDTPNFIGNRIGVFSLLATVHHAQRLSIPFEIVDALTGKLLGRPKSGTFRTLDVVGLDTMTHVIKTMADTLPEDPWHAYFETPAMVTRLIEQGALGQKSGAGIYRKVGKTIEVLDPAQGSYRPAEGKPDDGVVGCLRSEDPFDALLDCDHPEAEFVLACLRDLFQYAAYHLTDIAHTVRDVDYAMRWGYGWKLGPFEQWQHFGWHRVASWLQDQISSEQTMATASLPGWIEAIEVAHTPHGSYAPADGEYVPPPDDSLYERQIFRERTIAQRAPSFNELSSTDALSLWHLDNDILVASLKTKMHTLNQLAVDSLHQAIDRAEKSARAMIIWTEEPPFSAGADLSFALRAVRNGETELLETLIADFQQVGQRLRYAQIPTVAGMHGLALGGGCELALPCDARVAALETYVGLVEAGVGLLPGGGGLKEMAHRASRSIEPYRKLKQSFEHIAKGEVSSSALQAQDFGYLERSDRIIMHAREVLHVAKQVAMELSESTYRPPLALPFPVLGKAGLANLRTMLVNMKEGNFLSEHDYFVLESIAEVICGGEVDAGTRVDDDWLLRLEREHFLRLATSEKSQQRMEHMLATGKPLRN